MATTNGGTRVIQQLPSTMLEVSAISCPTAGHC
jgi:hypothetical protein